MPSTAELLSRAVDRSGELLPLAVVPLASTFLHWRRVGELLESTGRLFSVTFGFPRDVTTLWSFLNVQAEGLSLSLSPLETLAALPTFVGRALLVATVAGLLAAGYLGRIRAAVDGQDRSFLACVRAYAVPLVGFGYLETGVLLAAAAAGLVARPLVIPLVLGALVLAYLFYATPYLVVTADLSLVPALARSFDLAVSDGRYLGFFLGYVLANAVASVPISAVAFTGPPGVALAAVIAAPVALVLNTATLLFVRSLGGREGGPAQSNMPVDM